MDIEPSGISVGTAGLRDLASAELAILAGCAAVGGFCARVFRLSAAPMLGALVASAIVHVIGLCDSRPPSEVMVLAQIVMGAVIGARFQGGSVKFVAGTIWRGLLPALAMIAVAASLAWIIARLAGLSFPALALAFMPGGPAEMSLVALTLDIDAAFVATHNAARIALVVITAPLIYRLAIGRLRRSTTAAHERR